MLQCVAVCCGLLQYVAVFCGMLQSIAVMYRREAQRHTAPLPSPQGLSKFLKSQLHTHRVYSKSTSELTFENSSLSWAQGKDGENSQKSAR